MICPKCGGETQVSNSRSSADKVNRRRKCKSCGSVFSTVETVCEFFDNRKRSGYERRKIKKVPFEEYLS